MIPINPINPIIFPAPDAPTPERSPTISPMIPINPMIFTASGPAIADVLPCVRPLQRKLLQWAQEAGGE